MSAHIIFHKVYAIPVILSIITLAGLLLALFGDGTWDTLSWFFLAIPLAVIAYKSFFSPSAAYDYQRDENKTGR